MRTLIERLKTVSWWAALATVVLCCAGPQATGQDSPAGSKAPAAQKQKQEKKRATKQTRAEKQSKTAQSVQKQVEKHAAAKEKQEKGSLVQEAVSAVALTRQALKQLEEGNKAAALETLSQVTGKLELAVARNPDVAFLPVAVETTVYDLWASIETVEKLLKEAKEALEKGQVQVARRILSTLASEVVISTTKLPVALYPEAIRKVAPLIDAGKIEEAKKQLQAALNLLVVTDTVYPLPVLRSNAMLAEAKKLSEKSNRSDKENDRLKNLIAEIDHQVRLGRVLGYFDSQRAEKMLAELEQIRKRTQGGKSGEGFFDYIKELFEEWAKEWSDK